MKSECPPAPVKVDEYTSMLQTQAHEQKSEFELNSTGAHSPIDSDIDMEDDITHPHEAEKSCLSNNTTGERVSISQEAFVEVHGQDLQHTGGHKLPEVSIHGNLPFAEASVSKDQRGGSAVASDCEFTVTRKVSFEADDSGMIKTGQNEHPFDVSVNESAQHINISQDTVPIIEANTGQLLEGANSFKRLQGFASNSTSEKDGGENLLIDFIPPPVNDESLNAEKGFAFVSKVRFESLSESNKHMLSKPATESPRNVMGAGKSYFATGIVEEFSDKRHRGKDSVSDGTYVAFQTKGLSRNCDANIGLDGANFHKPDVKSNFTKLNLDEFGRLVREGVSDSDTSNSPHSTTRPAGRAIKKNSRQSRSRSPHDRRRRRRSPLRRKERRRRSRSSSPMRRRSRSRSPVLRRRSPVLRRDTECSGDKRRLEKGQLPECFDFLQGKCYRGATCRYSHHESDKKEKLRHNRGKQHALSSPDFHEETKVCSDNDLKNKRPKLPHGLKEAEDAKELPVDSTTYSPDKLNSLKPGSLLADSVVIDFHDMPSGKQNSVILEFPSQHSDNTPQTIDQQRKRIDDSLITESSSLLQASTATSTHLIADRPDPRQGPSSQLFSTRSLTMEPCSTEQVPSQSLKEFPPSVANHPAELTLPMPSVSQVISAPFAQPITQDYNMILPYSRFQSSCEKFPLHQPPAFYQHSRFSVPSNSSPSSFLPPPPQSHLGDDVTTREHSILSQHIQQPLLSLRDGLSPYASVIGQAAEMQNGQYQAYPLTWEPDKMVRITDNSGASSLHPSNLTTRHSGSHMMGEQHLTGYPVQSTSHSQSFAQAKPYSLLSQSPANRVHSSLAGGLPSDNNSSHGRPYFQQTSHVLQYNAAAGVPAQLAQPANVNRSSMSVVTPDFLERNHSSYVHDFVGSKISNHFNPYAYSTFDMPQNSKFSSNAFIQEKDAAINCEYNAPVESSSVPEHKNASVGSDTIISSSRSGLPADSILPRPCGDQYDPLFDSIEPTSNSSTRAEHKQHENTGDSDIMLRFCASGSVLNNEGIHPEGRTTLSVSDSLRNEEYGETADAEVGAVFNGSPSNPNDATDVSAGEIEIDQVKVSGEKKKVKDSRSMKLYKISIATFVKEVLKPSWRQGNMSKEAFKTIVKKTVDKVSGAMRSHHIPKSQAKINHYIDSSRGKLTKLVMGYVDKYAKV